MGNVIDIQCPCCSAPLHYNPKIGKMKCEYCDSEFSTKDLKKISDASVTTTSVLENHNEDYVSYNCPDCGAEIIADENTSATFCLYCGNTAILKNKLSGEFAPDKIIPFVKVKEDAILAFKNLSKGRPFMPRSFNSSKNIEKITGLYIPFWLYEVDVSGTVKAEGINVKTWTSGNTHYTKKDFYNLLRTGNMVYHKIPVDGSTRFANDIMNTLEPFHFNYLVDYNHAYLSGFLAEKYDVKKEDAFKDAEKRALASTKDVMLSDMGSYSSKVIKDSSLNAQCVGTQYVLLPVWMVNVKYHGKYYIFAMNGQTGEFIGDIPLDIKRVVVCFVLVFVIVFVLFLFVAFVVHLMTGGSL